MSAFIVSPECMNRVVNAACYFIPEFLGEKTPASADLDRTDAWNPNTIEAAQRIWARLYAMNGDAIMQRYGERDPVSDTAEFAPDRDGFAKPEDAAPIWLKAVSCLQYQCSEGNVPDSDWFKQLRELKMQVALFIATRTRAYRDAPWD